MRKTILSLATILTISGATMAQVQLPNLFSDGMVLQQRTTVPIWGKAKPGEKITIATTWSNKTFTATADNSGKWKTDIETPCYGGPYSIIATGSNTVYINNVMIGEVWLASGQSNMEMPMEGWLPECPVKNGPEDIAASTNNELRIFMAERAVSYTPEDNIKGEWKTASPTTTPKFGATCYYFARRLQSHLGIPIGIINTSWGGTPDESWIPEEYIKNVPEYTKSCDLIKQSRGKSVDATNWVTSHKSLDVSAKTWDKYNINDDKIKNKDFDDSNWKTTTVGQNIENDNNVRTYDGIFWYRKKINIPATMAGKDLIISLGNIDDMDITYYDGVEIGRYMQEGYWQQDRTYTVPANLVKAGEATIAIRVVDNQGGGGLVASPSKMKYYTKGNEASALTIPTDWKYLPVAELVGNQLFIYDIDKQDFFDKPMLPIDLGPNTPTCLYNAMVAPIVGYKIAGSIWYQGCSNVGRGEEYSRTFPLLIKSWRDLWQQGNFPFYFVQIAPWNYGDGPSYEIREAQRLTLALENTGMAVTMDIGDNNNIHPANKQEVGDRLARIALNNVYKKQMPFSGPEFQSQTIENNKLILTFKYSDGLYAKGGTLKGFEIAGKDGKYYPATATIVGDKVEVTSSSVKKPVSARYLWVNTVNDVTLYNSANLPSGSFQTTKCWKK